MSNADRIDLFDQWAKKYDQSIQESAGYPFDGYEELLDRIAELADPGPEMKILDLGTGTANLLERFAGFEENLWGMDYSNEMLEKAAVKIPQGTFIQCDIMGDWQKDLDQKFSRIISAYVFHEFPLKEKIVLLKRIAQTHLEENGFFILGDISFPSEEAQEIIRKRTGEGWDSEEYYWIAKESISALDTNGFSVQYEQISSCGGIYKISPNK